MTKSRKELRDSIPGNDVFKFLNGRCSPGIIQRVIREGIPDWGPGRWSVRHALEALRESLDPILHQSGLVPTIFKGRKARISSRR